MELFGEGESGGPKKKSISRRVKKISPTQASTIPVNVSQTLNVPVSSQVSSSLHFRKKNRNLNFCIF